MRLKVRPATVRAWIGPTARGLASTWRVRVREADRWRAARESGRPLVLFCWHEVLLPLLWLHRGQGITIVVSEARDGQYLADFAEDIGYRLVRGSSTRGATRALLGAVREVRAGRTVAFTPDGPRGPRRVVKPGALVAAQRGGGLVVPLHAEARRCWRLDSWDRFMIPKPFAEVVVTYGRTFEVGEGNAGLAEGVAAAAAALDAISGERA